jgi:hypothetical protein
MKDFGFNGMNDEEFREEFLRFLNTYQSTLESFMKKNYSSPKNYFVGPSSFGMEPFNLDSLKKLINEINENMNVEKGDDENGSWVKKNWSSPDGSTFFNSFSRSSYFNPFGEGLNLDEKYETEEVDTIKLLERKLNKAISRERYEDAAKIRDLIKSLKDDTK